VTRQRTSQRLGPGSASNRPEDLTDRSLPEGRLLSAAEALDTYGAEWRRLAIVRGNAFASPEWFEAWLLHYGPASDVRVAVVQGDSSELLGLVPFAIARGRFGRTARIAGANLADYLHPVAARDDEAAVAAAAIEAMTRDQTDWSTLVLDNVDAGARWWAGLSGRPDAMLRGRERSASVLPYASLPATYDEYLAGRSGSFRRQIRRRDRRLEEAASIVLRPTTERGLTADLETFFRLHFGRWNERGGSSLQAGRARAFHESLAPRALRAGWLRLLLLEADSEPIAAFYGWRLGGRYAFVQGGFDEAWSKYSVGLVLHGRVIESAIAEGAEEYNMLLGSEPYKFRFCDSARQVTTAVLTKRWHPAGAAIAAELAVRRVAARFPTGMKARLSRLERRLPTGRRR
jgi:CelD/BcsL family acetyltransferase involved in cellulose biosynthesis